MSASPAGLHASPEAKPPLAPLVLIGGVGVLAVTVVMGAGYTKLAAVLLIAGALAGAWHERLFSWPSLLTAMLLVIMLIPIKRYKMGGGLPFDLEPYRVVVALLIAAWCAALLVDARVRVRASGFELPLGLIVVATVGSEVVNPGRVNGVASYVVKAVTFFVSFVLFYYLIVSVVRRTDVVDRLLKVLVGSGAFVAVAALVERHTQFNVFDHLQGLIPMITLQATDLELRGGAVRAVASSGHPIELSVVLTMLTPLAFYLAMRTGRRRWWGALLLLALGDLTTGSRTGVIGLAAVGVVFVCMRPRQTLRLWPALLPALLVVHIAVPGALGGIREGFFPTGGLIAQQSAVVRGDQELANNRLADWGPSFQEYLGYNPLVGEGYGTRVTGFDSKLVNAPILDDQWLKTLLETGALGIVGWAWIFARAIRRLGRRARADTSSATAWLPVALASSIAAFAVSMLTYDAFSFLQGTLLMYTLLALSAVVMLAPLPPLAPARGRSSHGAA